MFTLAWWYLASVYAALWMGVFFGPVWTVGALALCVVQAVHFGIVDRNFFSFSCQVRYFLVVFIAGGLWMPWLVWMLLVGLTARLTLNYCLLARLIALLPWNHNQPFTWSLVRQTIFSRPVKGSILRAGEICHEA